MKRKPLSARPTGILAAAIWLLGALLVSAALSTCSPVEIHVMHFHRFSAPVPELPEPQPAPQTDRRRL